MNPFEKAQKCYVPNAPYTTFPQDLVVHLQYGYVINTPRLFLMGRPILKEAAYPLQTDPLHEFKSYDTWLVWLCAGSVGAAIGAMPFYLPWIAFSRRNVRKLNFYLTDDFKRHV